MSQRLIKRLYSTKSKVEDAFTRRLAELENEIVKETDPLLGSQHKSLIDKDERLIKLSNELDQKRFEHQNQKLIYASKIPSYAGKQSRDIAFSQPWTGQESQQDSSLRMLVDKHKPFKVKSEVRKLASAKETVLDYRINKNAEPETDADGKFRELYKEKFTPIGSFDKIRSVADARIEEHMKQGGFKNIPRGKKIEGIEVSAYVDRTEHHLNNILVNQNVVPPWIEKQGGVNLEIAIFRKELIDKWKSYITSNYNEDHKRMQKDFEASAKGEYEHKIKRLNSSIRTYNLQAPMPTQKFYAIHEKEFQRCFEAVDVKQVLIEHEEELLRRKIKNSAQNNQSASTSSFFSFWNWK
ncbi:hypothetical protein WICANDRAFT_80200 [Wickerhamomyces anomalus NRRL Y-366-8]|uniref:DnaJ homologue subfamily C member 28 conserved domain-containing protein n=1 Tax=Wickerhamomyces anomalus (strain ATCC 58044 / CBS 1984 / NCYC 433 / NRRL Y-366-8) TaxID=683960 RepID=A0A1E3NYG8_WICAA|nr:uncharacterized protein WICANDRAFT_80200 [Wickerhamomyces anomalus NRRL Y-366-8]ODQ58040.1 hypothetical protein WICANDRAFT_80200 [Wickerhamomyces anomalus NRRL Y-366-8]